jgi:hypothetical protein
MVAIMRLSVTNMNLPAVFIKGKYISPILYTGYKCLVTMFSCKYLVLQATVYRTSLSVLRSIKP